MSTRQRRNSRLGSYVIPVFCALITAYFLHHAFDGRLGLLARADIAHKTNELVTELAESKHQRELLATRVALLRSGTIEKDMLDEQARYHLNLIRSDEIIITRSSN